MGLYLIEIALASFVIALALTPLVRLWALRTGIMDIPNQRSLHCLPVARCGGIAIYFAFAFPVIYVMGSDPRLFYLFLGASVVFLTGLIDDIKGLSPLAKLGGQGLAAAILIAGGVKIGFLPEAISIPLTVLWLLGVTNALNLLDGMDGLAAGVSAIAALFFIILLFGKMDMSVLPAASALAGACLGFLLFNFHPARIFMGDTGSMFLGFVLGSLGVMNTFKSSAPLQLFVPVIILGVPIFDTSLAILRRLWRRKPLFEADCDHFYEWLWKNRLLGYRNIVIITYFVGLVLGFAALFIGGM